MRGALGFLTCNGRTAPTFDHIRTRSGRNEKAIVHLARDFMVKHRDFAVELPKFNVVAVKELLRPFHRLGIVGAVKGYRSIEMAVRTDDVSAVFHHATLPASELAFRF
jgi:serine protease inhibitor